MIPRSPIGCNEQDAQAYLGCTATTFDWLKRTKRLKPIRKGWYSYRMLDHMMQELEDSASKTGETLYIHEQANSKPQKGQKMGGKGDRPEHRSTKELLRTIPG